MVVGKNSQLESKLKKDFEGATQNPSQLSTVPNCSKTAFVTPG